MQNQKSFIVFDQEFASSYDKRRAKWSSVWDALHLLIRAVLSELPTNARILCVGVGTGSELIDLAQAFPHWHFTAVEPSAPMLDLCRQKAEASGITRFTKVISIRFPNRILSMRRLAFKFLMCLCSQRSGASFSIRSPPDFDPMGTW